MEIITYEPKTKSEHFILFKFLKLVAIFLGSWMGIWILAGMSRRTSKAMSEASAELISTVAIIGALLIVLYYIYSKVKTRQVEQVTFDYAQRKLKIKYKSYFLHLQTSAAFPLEKLRSSIKSKQSFLHGSCKILSVHYGKRRVLLIDESSSDWQRVPNFLVKIHERLSEIK